MPGIKRRDPVVSGIFYPEKPEAVCARLASWGLNESSNCPAIGSQAIIAPHGAWDFSGSIAGKAFAAARNLPLTGFQRPPGKGISRVLLLGPCHHPIEEGIYLSESVSFETPLGPLQVDWKLNRELASCSAQIRFNDIPHLSEHSLEVLLPIVKYCFSQVSIVPILVSGRGPAVVSALAGALRTGFSEYPEESLIVISSCVSQYPDEALALSMAEEFRRLLERMDPRAFLAGLEEGRITACGGALVAALMESGVMAGKRFNSLGPLSRGKGGLGETIYYGAFGA